MINLNCERFLLIFVGVLLCCLLKFNFGYNWFLLFAIY